MKGNLWINIKINYKLQQPAIQKIFLIFSNWCILEFDENKRKKYQITIFHTTHKDLEFFYHKN